MRPYGAPERRGRTEIAGRVLERIATRALYEVEQAGGVVPRLLGVPLGRDQSGRRPPAVRARVDGGLATLQMSVSVVYPAPVRQVTRRLRGHVARRVSELTGLVVRQVDIEVTSLTSAPAQQRQVL